MVNERHELGFIVKPPLESRREIFVNGHMDLVNRYAIGKDWWGHPRFDTVSAFLAPDYFPADDDELSSMRQESMHHVNRKSEAIDDWGHAEVQYTYDAQTEREKPTQRCFFVNWS